MGQPVEVVVSELASASARLDAAAQSLRDGLSSVDAETTQLMGAGWKGDAASAYVPAWAKWHEGAEQVVLGLQRMSELLSIAGKEYAKTDESASGAIDSTMQGSGGSAGGGGGTSGGSASGGGASEGAARASAGRITGGAGSTAGAGAGQATGSAEGIQQAMAAAMQLGQIAGQPLSQLGQGATGLAQTIAGLAQQAAQISTEAAGGEEEQQSATPQDSAAGSGTSTGIAPTGSAPTGRGDAPHAVDRPGE